MAPESEVSILLWRHGVAKARKSSSAHAALNGMTRALSRTNSWAIGSSVRAPGGWESRTDPRAAFIQFRALLHSLDFDLEAGIVGTKSRPKTMGERIYNYSRPAVSGNR